MRYMDILLQQRLKYGQVVIYFDLPAVDGYFDSFVIR
jgi:hypothetical protein